MAHWHAAAAHIQLGYLSVDGLGALHGSCKLLLSCLKLKLGEQQGWMKRVAVVNKTSNAIPIWRQCKYEG